MKDQKKKRFNQRMTWSTLAVAAMIILNSSFKAAPPNKARRTKKLSIIEYNVCDGFESQQQRINTFVQWAQKQNADVMAFEELNNFTQASFAKLAKTWGHPYAVIAKENGYPVGITSRYPITNVYKLIKGMHHGCLYAEINGISFFVVHFSPFSSAKRLQEADSVLNVLRQKGKMNERVIVLGDFNSFSHHDSLFYVGSGVRDSMYNSMKKNKILQNLNSKNELDYQVISSFLQSGFYDSFSLFHNDFEASYPTKIYDPQPLSERIRIDYIMVTEKLKASCKSVEIIKDNVTDTLSDHYPVKAEFVIK
ncbi:endonuclease/exonuclease/phosphatase family protein [Mucilaginibacter sp. X5P1]|uniref:endonuclease/exonuclease/phosphatase family protein n=1 Tax=Mucilaginibacter sp. X5P1 TaxID=2723088 RepID=UPI00160D3ED5|nr:endonuclease/exonuclease/phosphatase family protein [Mucilaginibacter sp. X5P1]MBB6139858.1 exonuclease III [Mucilaginibacter sp. X5P1]